MEIFGMAVNGIANKRWLILCGLTFVTFTLAGRPPSGFAQTTPGTTERSKSIEQNLAVSSNRREPRPLIDQVADELRDSSLSARDQVGPYVVSNG
jgi:hypothetical protein